MWFYVLFLKGCAQTCRHGAVFRRKGCRSDSPVASALWTLGLTSTGTVRSDSQTVAILQFSHHHTCIRIRICSKCWRKDGGEAYKAWMGMVSFPSLGLIVASALVDVSQQKPSDFKDKSQSLKSRKALPPAHQGTCVWATAPPSTGSFSLPSERHVKLEAFQRNGQNTIWLLRLKSSPVLAHSPKVGWRAMLLWSRLCLRQVTSPELRLRSSRYHRADLCPRPSRIFAP